jgi:spore coat polysaccharide biosynthesis protein SpsF
VSVSTNYIAGFITVRVSSTRLPGKCLLPFGEGNVLNHVIQRTRSYGIEPIVCTSTDISDDIIEEIAVKDQVRFFRGSLVNKLKRWSDCAAYFGIEGFHTVDADDPFFDGDEMKESMKILFKESLDLVEPSEISSNGAGSVGYSIKTKLIQKAIENIAEEEDTEMMWEFLKKVPNVKLTKMKDNERAPKKLRLTLDYQEDYWLIESVRKMVSVNARREEIDNLFKRNPDLYLINWFRNNEWKNSQNKKIKQIK